MKTLPHWFMPAMGGLVVVALVATGTLWWMRGRSSVSPETVAEAVPVPVEEQQASVSESFKIEPLNQEFVFDEAPAVATPASTGTIAVLNESESAPVTSSSSEAPAPVAFKAFSYNAVTGKHIVIAGPCSDATYAFLVFRSTDDYRKNPAAAFLNNAFPCPATKKFRNEFDLKDFNLQTGTYYMFVADQGATGSWYNPR